MILLQKGYFFRYFLTRISQITRIIRFTKFQKFRKSSSIRVISEIGVKKKLIIENTLW